MLVRKYEDELRGYLSKKTQATLVDGARHVGKTILIRKVAQEMGRPFFEFNLIERKERKERNIWICMCRV